MMEAHFKKHAAVFSSANHQCGQVGEDLETTNLAKFWTDGLSAAKIFIKARSTHRRFSHSQSTSSPQPTSHTT